MHIMHEPLFETPNGIIVLPLEHVRKVTDIEEELFFLYTLRGTPPEYVGLGCVNSRSDEVSISLDTPSALRPSKGRRSTSESATVFQDVRIC